MTTATGTVQPAPGRNQPCPCGSGKKYKNCCRSADELRGRGVAAMFDRESALAHSILDWANKRLGAPWRSVAFALEGEGHHHVNHFTTSCSLHAVPFQGRPASAWYQDAHAHLSPIEREFLASARAAWTSAWEVRELGESRALLVDRLTGEERRATLHPDQDWLEVGELMLARVGLLAGEPFLHAADPDTLPPKEAEAVLGLLRSRLGSEPPIGSERPASAEAAATLSTTWREFHSAYRERVDAEQERLEARPELTDHFSFAPEDRAAIEQGLLALPGAEDIYRDEVGFDLVVKDLAHPDTGDGDLGLVFLFSDRLNLETRSAGQADELRKLVEAHCGASLRFVERTIEEFNPNEDSVSDEDAFVDADVHELVRPRAAAVDVEETSLDADG